MKHFWVPVLSLVAGLFLAAGLTWNNTNDIAAVVQVVLIVSLLCVLEISLSFDNAVVNAAVLQKMNKVWQQRFLTWGILIAVFGMRFLFPLVIVSVISHVSLYESLVMAISRPQEYATMMLGAHLAVSAFGGAFLLMVFLDYFFSHEKEVHWIQIIEKPAAKMAVFQSIELVLAIAIMMGIHAYIPESEKLTFLISYMWGMLTYMIVHGISGILEGGHLSKIKFFSSGFGMFLYLEVLDASFSFDGVVGAFAISNQLMVIMIGLGVGAFFVRAITLYLVENQTLNQFKFLEHGAFYALGVLAFFMLLDSFFHFPEWLTALTGAVILGVSILWSMYEEKRDGRRNPAVK